MRRFLIATLISYALLLAGCGGANFSCMEKVDMEGIKCEPPSSVYEQLIAGGGDFESPKKKDKKSKKEKQTLSSTEESIGERVVRQLNYDGPEKPIRIPPKIIRIWVAPWEDEQGDLHRGEEIFSEITPTKGRWLFGDKVETYGVQITKSLQTDVLPQKAEEDNKKRSPRKEQNPQVEKKESRTPVIKKSEE